MAIAGSHNLNCREDALSFREAFLGWYRFWVNSFPSIFNLYVVGLLDARAWA